MKTLSEMTKEEYVDYVDQLLVLYRQNSKFAVAPRNFFYEGVGYGDDYPQNKLSKRTLDLIMKSLKLYQKETKCKK